MASPDNNIPTISEENGMTIDSNCAQVPKSAPFLAAVLPPIGSAVRESGDGRQSGPLLISAIDHEGSNIEPMDADDLERSSSNLSEVRFDTCIGHIEDIIMEDEFQTMQNAFLDQYYEEFEDTEENKFSYTDIHNEYIRTVESYLDTQLIRRMPGFTMAEFAQQLQRRQQDEVLDGEIFEILLTFTDFTAFKEMMLDRKLEKEGRSTDLSGMLTVTKKS